MDLKNHSEKGVLRPCHVTKVTVAHVKGPALRAHGHSVTSGHRLGKTDLFPREPVLIPYLLAS